MKVVYLTQGCVAIVDDEDYEAVMKHKWHVVENRHRKNCKHYAQAMISSDRKTQSPIMMHQLVLGGTSKTKHADHINGYGLDNRRENLRLVMPGQNSMNQGRKTNDMFHNSEYKGITWKKNANAWLAQICTNRVQKTYGCWKTESAAALNYDYMSLKLHGEFGRNNNLFSRKKEIMVAELEQQTSVRMWDNTIKRFKQYLGATDEEIDEIVCSSKKNGKLPKEFLVGIVT